jgi:hypothetical protein
MTQWYLLKDSDGKKSVSYTMVVITFTVLTMWLTLSMFTKVVHVDIREFDASGASLWFTPIATLYFSRKWHQAQVDANKLLASERAEDVGEDRAAKTEEVSDAEEKA